jgi:zinc/manganese transport system permease protein
MEVSLNDIELSILLPALIAGLLVLATHIPFGMKVLERGVIFADLAVAQIAGLGVIIAGLLDLTGKPPLAASTKVRPIRALRRGAAGMDRKSSG